MSEGQPVIGFKIEIIIEPDDTGYHAYCPALRGLHTCGDTEQEALQNARDAAIAYLQSLMKHNDPIPVGIIMQGEAEDIQPSPIKRITRHTEDLTVSYAI